MKGCHKAKQNDKFKLDGLNLFDYIRPNGIPKSESKDYKTNNSCSASPNISKIDTSQGCHIMVATLVIVRIKVSSEISVTGINFHNFKAKFVYHTGNCFIAS